MLDSNWLSPCCFMVVFVCVGLGIVILCLVAYIGALMSYCIVGYIEF
jgi:hypothetical protein